MNYLTFCIVQRRNASLSKILNEIENICCWINLKAKLNVTSGKIYKLGEANLDLKTIY